MLPDSLQTSLRADVRSGAAEIARRAALGLATEVERSAASDAARLRHELVASCRLLIAAQPAMSSLLALGAAVLSAAQPDVTLAEARRDVLAALTDFGARLDRATHHVAVRAQALVPAGGRVLTLSNSSTVRETLLEGARRRSLEAVCLEGRPNFEGRELAEALAARGVPCRIAVDAAATALAADCDIVLVGADSIGDAGFVNKVGTHALALAAHTAGIPLYVLADWTKVLPRGYPQHLDDERPPREVWPSPPSGVGIWNQYFEATALTLCTGVVSDTGLCSPAELEAKRGRMQLPPELRA